MLRNPAVAGYFYKDSPAALKKQVESFLIPIAKRTKAIGVVSPHAGFIYSGPVAGAVYSSVEIPDIVVLIGPNHTGLGESVSLMAEGLWETPLGTVEIDKTLAASIVAKSSRIRKDSLAHLHEHSLEVQLPFLQYFKKDFKIVPIQMLDTRLETCLEVGRAVGEAIADCGLLIADCKTKEKHEIRDAESKFAIRNSQSEIPSMLIIASSDMTHYEEAGRAKDKDFKAIQSILDLDPEGLYRTIKDNGITMCGYGPTVAMLTAAKMLGASKAELVKYANSGDVSGDYGKVVGYAGVIVY